MVLEKEEEKQLDRSRKKWRNITQNQGGEKYPTHNNKKKCQLDWSHLAWELPLKHVTEGKIKDEEDVSSYWMTFKKDMIVEIERESSRSRSGELALEEAMDLW